MNPEKSLLQCLKAFWPGLIVLVFTALPLYSQGTEEDSIRMDAVWIPDNGDGTYTNPIIYADYSDPDVVRVEDDFYMVASSFNCVPGIPVLHSKDLVNWTLIGHVFANQPPDEVYDNPGHGVGVWAPSIRYRNGEFYVYYGDPDYGIYLAKAADPAGPWEHKLVQSAYGWIDPCPFWDDNDSAYLVHAYAKSRTGFNGILTLRRMSRDGESISLTDTIVLFDGTDPAHPRKTIEGPKMYKRNGYYYVFAPYGGVAGGSQAVLRADTVTGPYKDTTVLERGSTDINGPHQGGWVELTSGESWFLHFQENLPYGRILHLQPVQWINDWPFMGEDYDGNTIGEPVPSFAKPDVQASYPVQNPQTSDKFDSADLGLQWQWHSNVDSTWWSLTESPGRLRLNAARLPADYVNLWDVGSMALQKLPAPRFSVTTKVDLQLNVGEKAGLLIMGIKYSYIGIVQTDTALVLSQRQCTSAESGGTEREILNSARSVPDGPVYLRVGVSAGGKCDFSYSLDGIRYHPVGSTFTSDEGKWIGAKVGLFCHRPYNNPGDPGYADFEWFNVDYYYNALPLAAENPVPADGDTNLVVGPDFGLSWEGDEVFTDSFYVWFGTEPDPVTLLATQKNTTVKPGALEVGQTYYWRVDAKNDKGVTGGPAWSFTVRDIDTYLPDKRSGFELEQNRPNAFSDFTRISFTIPNAAGVRLRIFALNGTLVEVLADRQYPAGTHTLRFGRGNIPAGTYLLRMEVEDKVLTRKMIIQ